MEGRAGGWEEGGTGDSIFWRSFSKDRSTDSEEGGASEAVGVGLETERSAATGAEAVGGFLIASILVSVSVLTATALMLVVFFAASGTFEAGLSFSTHVGFAWRQSFMM